MKARAHVIVSGHVQGVFFRSEIGRMASQLGVNGWVMNRPDGKVEAVFEGDRENVESILGFCRKGPTGAHIDDIAVDREAYKGEFSGFSIRH